MPVLQPPLTECVFTWLAVLLQDPVQVSATGLIPLLSSFFSSQHYSTLSKVWTSRRQKLHGRLQWREG